VGKQKREILDEAKFGMKLAKSMNGKQHIEAFEMFLKILAKSAKLGADRILIHDNYFLPGNLPDLVFGMMSRDFSRQLINAVNTFFFDIRRADSWVQVANSYRENDRASLLSIHAGPLLELSVSRPYSLRNQFIYAATHLLHQSNQLKNPAWRDDLRTDDWFNEEKDLFPRSNGWTKFPAFRAKLDLLNDRSFKNATHDFRHRMQHRFGLHFDLGLQPHYIRSKKNGTISYTYVLIPPLELKTTISHLFEQHKRAIDVFKAYWDLVGELENLWSDYVAFKKKAVPQPGLPSAFASFARQKFKRQLPQTSIPK
jgi:hypothetical protein